MHLSKEEDLEIISDPLATVAPIFALTPAQTNARNVIDQTISSGVKVYNAATA